MAAADCCLSAILRRNCDLSPAAQHGKGRCAPNATTAHFYRQYMAEAERDLAGWRDQLGTPRPVPPIFIEFEVPSFPGFDNGLMTSCINSRNLVEGEETRPYVFAHSSLSKDSPGHRPVQRYGQGVARPILGRLHHEYCRMSYSADTGVPEAGPPAALTAGAQRPGRSFVGFRA